MEAIGRIAWVIADGYIPATSNGPEPEMVSHESFCVLNTGDSPAHLEVFVYYADREPVGPYRVEVAARIDPRRRLEVAGLEHRVRLMIAVPGVHRADEREAVEHGGLARQQLADAHAGQPGLDAVERPAIAERAIRLGIPGIDVARPAGHPQQDDALARGQGGIA